MLASFVLFILWVFSRLLISVSFSLSICVFVFCLFFLIVSGYSGFLCRSFVRLHGRLDILDLLLICLSVWVSVLMFLVSIKYRFNKVSPALFSFSVGVLIIVVVVFFFTDNFLVFYVMFEFSLLPTLYLILK